jgi:hypothetical protein
MNRRAFLFASLAAFGVDKVATSGAAQAASGLQVIYVGGWDCPPCRHWRTAYEAKWLASPEFKRVTWTEVEAPRLKEAYRERYWPGELRAVLEQLPKKSGTPRFLIVKDGRVVSNQFGGSKWLNTMADLRKLLGE